MTQLLVTEKKNILPQIEVEALQNSPAIVVPSPSFHPSISTSLRIILVRHGETDWNIEKRFQGQMNIPLNAKGKQQAKAVREFLSTISIDCAFSSSLSRAKETAALILEGRVVSFSTIDELKEINHGDWNGMLETQIENLYPQDFRYWKTHPTRAHKPNGEALEQVVERVIPAWDDLISTHTSVIPQTILVVAHKWINQIILCHVCGLGLEHFGRFRQDNCAINLIDYPQGNNGLGYLKETNISPKLRDSMRV